MALSIKYSNPADAVYYYADGAVKSDSWKDVPLAKKNELYDAIIAKIPKNAPFKVLDVGCGPGGLALRLAQANAMPNFTYVGIDLSPKAIATAKGHGLDPAKYTFEVQNAYEYLAQKECDWDYLVSSMFLYGHDAETLEALRVPFFRHARKGVIIAAGAEYQAAMQPFATNMTSLAGQSLPEDMVVAFKELPPQVVVPLLNIPLRARLAETGAFNYAIADLAFKNTTLWPANFQGATLQKENQGRAGSLINQTFVPLSVPKKQKV